MKIIFILLVIHVVFFKTNFISAQTKKDTIFVFYLGGQSNMAGLGKVVELPKYLDRVFDNVMIFQGNSVRDNGMQGGEGIWEKLQPGHGSGFQSDGKINKLSETFGVELSFADFILKKYPKKKVAIIKYAASECTLDSIGTKNYGSWSPDYKAKDLQFKNQYDFFLKTVQKATSIKDINNDETEDILVSAGILWMQGESDANKTIEVANSYYKNLKNIAALFRATFRDNNLPIIIGKISDSGQEADRKVWDYCNIVQKAQEDFVKDDANAKIIRSTLSYKYSDIYHYDSQGYIDFGVEFGKLVVLP